MDEHDNLALFIQILMALLGGSARILNSKDPHYKLAHVLSELFISGVTGLILYWISRAMNVDTAWMYAASGIAGWAGPRALDSILKMLQKKTGIDLEPAKNETEKGE